LINQAARSGGDARLVRIVREEFAGSRHEIVIPSSYAEMCEAARTAVTDGVDVVVVVGGDGTLNAVANQLVGSNVALAVVPAGTANDLARQLGMPMTPREACQAILAGRRAAMDAIQVNGQHFLTGGGTGLVSEVAIGVQGLKTRNGRIGRLTRALGSLAYTSYSVLLLAFARNVDQKITPYLDDEALPTRRTLALFVNNQATIGRCVTACPQALPDDGRLEVCVIGKRVRWQSLFTALLLNLGGRHVDRREVRLGQGRELTLKSPEPMDFIGDGELLAQALELRLKVVPAALQILLPGGGEDFFPRPYSVRATSKWA
jgi:YegS/Rv2252/BmrU family lipid kinase